MEHKSDAQLLRDYAKQGVESAFAEIVSRHTNLVYSAALRKVESSEVAADVAQRVFLALLQSASTLSANLSENASLAGWLCRSACNISLNLRRDEFRRRSRERAAMEQFSAAPEETAGWEHLAPILDEAMSELKEPDCDALVLRFFRNNSLQEVGRALGVNEDAAQKRVSRALEKLREILRRRGVQATSGALAVTLSTHAVQAAPAGLAMAISSGSLAAFAATATNIIAMTALQKTIIWTALVAVLGAGVYQNRDTLSRQADAGERQEQPGSSTGELKQRHTSAPPAANINSGQEQNPPPTRGPSALPRKEIADPPIAHPDFQTPADNLPDQAVQQELPKETWGDVGFATPANALQTRGWTILNGDRERFKESVFITADARQTLEDMFVRMAEASNDPNKAQFIQQVLDNELTVEDGILMPMMAENRHKGYAGYRILAQESPAPDQAIVHLEIQMTTGPARKETLRLLRIEGNWKVLIDDQFIKAQR